MPISRRSLGLIALLGAGLLFGILFTLRPPLSLAQINLTPSVTPTITFLPTFTFPPSNTPFGGSPVPTLNIPSATPSFCLTPLDFRPGDTVVLIGGISVRAEPNPNSALLANYQDRREFFIIGEVVCFGGFNFWAIAGQDIVGWVAEGRGNDYWLSLVKRASDPAIPCLTPQELVPGERFNLTFNIRLRREPSLSALTDTIVPSGDFVRILEGPVCADGYNWWRVRATVVGVVYEGWMAEANRAGVVYINEPTPTSVCDFPRYFDIGERVRVDYGDRIPKNLRAAPNTASAILATLLDGVPMIIVGGPVCSENFNWWQVRVLASTEIVGWIAEGGPASYWISPNSLP
ncbi:MAG: SH3 domain-containing protein [Armatimonadetes bacterium]|nr:SH3 domain-containing protein [Anaerolineae bacterium]